MQLFFVFFALLSYSPKKSIGAENLHWRLVTFFQLVSKQTNKTKRKYLFERYLLPYNWMLTFYTTFSVEQLELVNLHSVIFIVLGFI